MCQNFTCITCSIFKHSRLSLVNKRLLVILLCTLFSYVHSLKESRWFTRINLDGTFFLIYHLFGSCE